VQAVSNARERQKKALLARHTNKLEVHVKRKRQHLKRRSAEATVDLDKIRRHEEKLSAERAKRREEIDAKLAFAERKRSIIRSGQNERRQTLEQETRRMSVLATRVALDAMAAKTAAETEKELIPVDPTPPTTPLLKGQDGQDDVMASLVAERVGAAGSIQAAWRRSYFAKQVHAFEQTPFASLLHASVGLEKSAPAPPFEELSRIIRGDESVAACQKLLTRLWAVLPAKQESNLRRVKPALGSRMLMSSLMVLHHPDAVLSNRSGDIELMVCRDARLLVDAFSAWTRASCCSRSTFRAVCKVWDRYNQTFGIWKELDSARIIQGLVDTYMELNALKESVHGMDTGGGGDTMTDDEVVAAISASPQAQEWLPKIFAQQRAIRERLCRLGADTAIAEALEFQKTLVADARAEEHSSNPEPPSQQAPVRNDTNVATRATDEKQHTGLVNAKLAREIIANPDFCLEKKSADDGMEYHIKQIAERAFYDLLREELGQSPPNCRRIPSLVSELRGELLELLSEDDADRRRGVLDLCDPEFITDQMEKNAFDAPHYMGSVVTVLQTMCSPFRDSDVSSLRVSEDITDFFQKVFKVVESMKLDLANFRLQAMRPHLVEIGVTYEREKFEECLQQGDITLERTTEWLREAVTALREGGCINPTPSACIEGAYIHLFRGPLEKMPETLELDKARVLEWKDTLSHLDFAATSMTLLKAVLPRLSDLSQDLSPAILGTVKNFFEKYTAKENTEDAVSWFVASISKTAVSAMKDAGIAGAGMGRNAQALLDGQIRASVTGESPVRKVLSGRIDSYILECIRSVAARYGSQKYVLSPPHPSLAPVGKDLCEVCLRIAQLTSHNRDVHQPVYDRIIKEALA
jgi:hypothetical protein